MPYGKYLNEQPANAPAYYPNSVVVLGNGSSPSSSSGSSSSLQRIIDSGVPITSGNSGSQVSNSSASLGALSGLNFDFNGLFDLIRENTTLNNLWSAEQAQKQMDFQTQSNQIAMDFNAAEAAKNRDWQEMMSNTAHQREMADLKAAGLNPVLTATGGNGAPVTSGSAASGVTSGGAMADADQSANTALASIYGALVNAQTQMYNANLSAQTNLRMAEMQQQATMYGAQLAAEASKYGAGVNAAAMNYSADMSFKNNEAQREWNAAHPSNAYQLGSTLFGGNSGISGAKNNATTWIQENAAVGSIADLMLNGYSLKEAVAIADARRNRK